jgi:hypothetical protein
MFDEVRYLIVADLKVGISGLILTLLKNTNYKGFIPQKLIEILSETWELSI